MLPTAEELRVYLEIKNWEAYLGDSNLMRRNPDGYLRMYMKVIKEKRSFYKRKFKKLRKKGIKCKSKMCFKMYMCILFKNEPFSIEHSIRNLSSFYGVPFIKIKKEIYDLTR